SAGTKEKVTEALLLGAKNFIVKPFKEEKVLEVIKAALS
ncbi:MAG: two-component system response regulator, partial [Anaerolineae bacterium]|nr:two-component system response regulator [Anaerolineae bacterium]NIN97964.1 two-component system response regulator [Anaerolineae bacterium]NIQ80928.1 two-component system response regulator [Anaerolineae bacterium]